MEWKRSRTRLINKPPAVYRLYIFLFSLSALFSCISSIPICQGSTRPFFADADAADMQLQEKSSVILARRFLGGLGSSPPRCLWKCGKCTPCRPVHVAVPPGTPVTSEYYPEAWRCKCGNKLYMP